MHSNYKEAKEIREKLGFIGRYQEGISPKLSKYQELEAEKARLRKKLKELNAPEAGTNPKPFKKHKHH